MWNSYFLVASQPRVVHRVLGFVCVHRKFKMFLKLKTIDLAHYAVFAKRSFKYFAIEIRYDLNLTLV
jgi:hypothetical protein